MVNPELVFQLWKYESDERLRTAARRQLIREARLARTAERSQEETGSPFLQNNWETVVGEAALRPPRLWHHRHQVGELEPCQSEPC